MTVPAEPPSSATSADDDEISALLAKVYLIALQRAQMARKAVLEEKPAGQSKAVPQDTSENTTKETKSS